jgi:hypothetical protein
VGSSANAKPPGETHPSQPAQDRIYWVLYELADSVLCVGECGEVVDLNYAHWSVFSSYANSIRPERYYKNGNNWIVLWNIEEDHS